MGRRSFILAIVFVFSLLLTGIGSPVLPTAASPERLEVGMYPVVPTLRGAMLNRVRSLVRVGRRLGNRPNVFSKIGDSITQWDFFLGQAGAGALRLERFGNLKPAYDWYMGGNARTANSFANVSLAARGGWTTRDLLDPAQWTAFGVCQNISPLECELGMTRPAVALIMIGTNDVILGDIGSFRANLNRIVTITERYGVVPILSTIPFRFDSPGRPDLVNAFNQEIVKIAQAHSIPLWNYWLAIAPLPNNGVSIDGVHPSVPPDQVTVVFDDTHLQFGFTVRNLTALQVLNSLLPALR